nr:MAG TPA: hypothetical protein [Caudoviricetes sp.]
MNDCYLSDIFLSNLKLENFYYHQPKAPVKKNSEFFRLFVMPFFSQEKGVAF